VSRADTRGTAPAGAWLLLLAFVLAAGAAVAAPEFPPLTGRVVDQADILSSSVEGELTRKLKSHEAETTNQVVVVTLPSLQGYPIEDFGYQLGRHWGIGQEGRNNGALLIVAPQERKVRIEVGYGLEGDLTDALAKLIIENEITPAFRKGSYDKGVGAGVDAILAAIAGTYEAKPRGTSGQAAGKVGPFLVIVFLLLLFGLPFCIFLANLDDRSGGPWGGRSSGWGRGSGGGFGGGGGGFSGGGGGFGGGGSSGGW